MEDLFRGVDGSNVPKEQWFHPDPSILPPPLTEESKELARKAQEEFKEKVLVEKNDSRKMRPRRVAVLLSDRIII